MPTNEAEMDTITSLINMLHLEDLRNEAHPSLFDTNPGYDVLIIRLPVVEKKLRIDSIGFILTESGSFLYDKADERFHALGDRFEGPHRIIDPVLDRLIKAFSVYQDRIADMEEALYEDRTAPTFMTEWLGLKRDILRIERVLARTAVVLGEVTEHYKPMENFPVDHYADLHEHTDRILRSASHHLSKLDYIYNFYNTRTSEKMNGLIYLLTVISAIFLPLNLLVGFFGMNTGGLPFAGSDGGTLDASLLMVSLLVLTSVILILWHKKHVNTSE
jgi:magnesium transporter